MGSAHYTSKFLGCSGTLLSDHYTWLYTKIAKFYQWICFVESTLTFYVSAQHFHTPSSHHWQANRHNEKVRGPRRRQCNTNSDRFKKIKMEDTSVNQETDPENCSVSC